MFLSKPVHRQHLYFSEEKKNLLFFLAHPPTVVICVYMLSIPTVPTGPDTDKSCPVCFFILSMSVCSNTVPCPPRSQCLHKAQLKGQKFLVFQGMSNTWGARFMRQCNAKAKAARVGGWTVWNVYLFCICSMYLCFHMHIFLFRVKKILISQK